MTKKNLEEQVEDCKSGLDFYIKLSKHSDHPSVLEQIKRYENKYHELTGEYYG
jgi:hypothetical protein